MIIALRIIITTPVRIAIDKIPNTIYMIELLITDNLAMVSQLCVHKKIKGLNGSSLTLIRKNTISNYKDL